MSLSAILFLFLTHLSIGIICTLVIVPRAAGVKFFRFNAGLAVVLLAVALAFGPGPDELVGATGGLAALALRVTTAALLAYWILAGRALSRLQPALLRTGVVAGVLAIVMQAWTIAAALPQASTTLAIASFLSSAALLGGACTAMILGHWYLVLPSMDVSFLKTIVKFHIGSTIVRTAVVSAAVFLAIATWEPGMGPSFQRYILSSAGIFFWQRVLFGLLGPSILAYLTWETAKIRSTQSATGILYVDFFTVIVGEVLAKYLFLSTSVPV